MRKGIINLMVSTVEVTAVIAPEEKATEFSPYENRESRLERKMSRALEICGTKRSDTPTIRAPGGQEGECEIRLLIFGKIHKPRDPRSCVLRQAKPNDILHRTRHN